ncbi:MAG: enoyl-CoA hydratase-related protein [Chloroflexi bacterium]|nr:enoyl-CoA hydratase-related protein [Chloroflexota bacterium]MCY3582629.1 enoyl-CoA hydratase-related protein [Chloroflexota bacterium]MCY3715870.1 enoyl-CoA hydratase-related protein [Chloroflexota bacterium]MDE2649865.1 enoyl-CoA hydratase-related protein [Chloroflexota bacterium]MXV92734.1 enoyl-CoA hydratase [Chloroflexota bacterium]
MSYEHILVDRPADGVGCIALNRPQALNALNSPLLDEVKRALYDFDTDPTIGAIILTGGDKVFAAGADIKEMDGKTQIDMLMGDSLVDRFDFSRVRKPIIAAVAGYALGGGCELAMACDMIVAADSAVFGQPEINLGILPGAGGTQRLTRAVGKALAMEIMLTDRRLSADEALRAGLVNRVAPQADFMALAVEIAQKVARRSQVAVRLTKEAINKAQESPLSEGLAFERRNFLIAFGSEDKVEGMRAFIEKRRAVWRNR